MPINIRGKEYVTVAERVKAIHEAEKQFSIVTELLSTNPVVVKATVTTPKGTFTGISYANDEKLIEKQSPYEVAETSAVGRALGFAGYGLVDEIASAEEMVKAGVKPETKKVFVEDPRDHIDFSSVAEEIKPKVGEVHNYCTVCAGHVSVAEKKYCLEKKLPIMCFDCQRKKSVVSKTDLGKERLAKAKTANA